MVSNDKSFWEQIDAILVINLPHRSDRWTQLLAKLESIGVAHKAVRIDAIDGKKLSGYEQKPWFRKRTPDPVARMKAGSAGCCLSHRKAIELAKERGYEKILLMEDDANFKDPLKGEMGDFLGRFLQDETEWDMLYLGFYMKKCPYRVESSTHIANATYNIWRIRGPLMLHAVVINHRIFDSLIDGLPTKKNIWPWMTYWGSIDSWITNSFGRDPSIKIAGCRPNLVTQKANFSDICGRVTSIEESEFTHKPSVSIELDADELVVAIRHSVFEKTHQTIKRSCRVLKAYLFGYSKT